jgi:hypothetical protein
MVGTYITIGSKEEIIICSLEQNVYTGLSVGSL